MSTFLASLTTVAISPYAFVAYLALVAAWAVIAVRTSRLKTIARALSLVPESDRKALLEKDYGFHLREGMSANEFLRAQRASHLFLAFLAVLAAGTLLVVLAILRPPPAPADPVAAAVSSIVEAIDQDFLSLKGRRDPDGAVEAGAETFESTVSIPGTRYNYIEYQRNEVPYFIASLYHGPDERVAASRYHEFTELVRRMFPDWLEHNQMLDREKPFVDYTTFVKGQRKIIVDINTDAEARGNLHVMATFKKPDPRGDDTEHPDPAVHAPSSPK